MTVQELKDKLSVYPDDMLVFVKSDTGAYNYGNVHTVRTIDIVMQDGTDEEILSVVIEES